MTLAMHPSKEAGLTDETSRAKGWLASWRPDVVFWAVISVTGWVIIAVMFTTMAPEDKAKVAGAADAADLSRIAPAAGTPARRTD